MAQVVGKDHHTNKMNCSCVDLEDWFLRMLWRKTKFKYDADVWIKAEVGFSWAEVLPVGISINIGDVSCSGEKERLREESEGFLSWAFYRYEFYCLMGKRWKELGTEVGLTIAVLT